MAHTNQRRRLNEDIAREGKKIVDGRYVPSATANATPAPPIDYSGGITLDGTQQLQVDNVGAVSMIYLQDQVTEYTESPFYMFNTANTFRDAYWFNRTLTPSEISRHHSDPEGFFQDAQNGVITGCLSIIPMDGDDKYVKDYLNYTIGDNDTSNPVFAINSETAGPENTLSVSGDTFTIHQSIKTQQEYIPYLGFEKTYIPNARWLFEATITVTSGTMNVFLWEGYENGSNHNYFIQEDINVGEPLKISFISSIREDGKANLVFNGMIKSVYDSTVKYSTRQVTGLYEISNYNSSVR